MTRWVSEVVDAITQAKEALVDLRVCAAMNNDEDIALRPLISLYIYLGQLRAVFEYELRGAYGQSRSRDRGSECFDWDSVFLGDLKQQDLLKKSINDDCSRIEQWAHACVANE